MDDLPAKRNGISRRRLLGGAALGVPAVVGLGGLITNGAPGGDRALAAPAPGHAGHGDFPHASFAPGRTVDHRANGFDPTEVLRDFDYGKTRRLASGRVVREWEIIAHDREIEVAPGVKYEAWTYNGRVPGPTLRAREGELLRVRFVNGSEHPHTMHFHGIHTAQMDGMPGIGESRGGGQIESGEDFVYEFDATPFGIHLYHCHVAPLAAHISRGLYGAFVIDPKQGRPEADEMVMVMNGFDTNFDLANEVYAVNTVGFHYVNEPIVVPRDRLVRIYLVNVLEYDPVNSFHIHGNFFQYYPTGTSLQPSELTDTVIQGQAQRGILELKFPFDGDYMFHAHVSEFAELGWSGFFRVGDPSRLSAAAAAASYCELPLGRQRGAGLMEAGARAERGAGAGLPAWALGLIPLALIAIAIGSFALLGGPGLGERTGPPVEEVSVERTVLHPGQIELTLRNDGPDPVEVAQVAVNDAYAPFVIEGGREIGRLGSVTLDVSYPWIEGEAYEIFVLTSSGGTIAAEIPVAAETPQADLDFYGLMALLGIYVGVIPVSLGMLWLPFLDRLGRRWMSTLIAFTVGLLAFLAIDAGLEGLEIAAEAPAAFGGTSLVFLGAFVAYLCLAGIDAHLSRRSRLSGGSAATGGAYLALLVAVGIGLHNLGEGLAIGSAYATGALALGAFLVVGFAIHNTTEGLAIVAPLRGGADGATARPGLARLLGLGLIAGAPAILGAWIGASAFNPSLAALLFGVGVGAIVRVIVQLAPSMRDEDGRLLYPSTVAGMLGGIAVLYLTGLLVSV